MSHETLLAFRASREAAIADFSRAKQHRKDALDEHLEAEVGMSDACARVADVTERMHRAKRDEADALGSRDAAVAHAAAIQHGAPRGMSVTLDEVIAAPHNIAQAAQVARKANAHRTRVAALLSSARAEIPCRELALRAADAAFDVADVGVAAAQERLDAAICAFETAKWESLDRMELPSDRE